MEGLYSDPSLSRDPKNLRPFQVETTITVPRAAPGNAIANSNNLVTQVTNEPYPALPPKPNLEGENEDGPPTPIGPLRAPFASTPNGTAPQALGLASYPGTVGAGAAVVTFVRNSGNNGTAVNFPPDPSASASGDPANLVIATGNLSVKYSTDGGDTFTTINNFSTVFGDNPDGGCCCDQVMHYVPSVDRIVWLIQTNQPTDAKGYPNGPNALRIAWAKPSDVVANFNTAWT